MNRVIANTRTTVFAIGIFSGLLSALLLIPMAVDILMCGGDWNAFFISSIISALMGASCLLNGKPCHIKKAVAMHVACIVWIALPFLAALPFVFSNTAKLSYGDALFEAMSGITTTGATVLNNLHQRSPGILLWRAMLNAIGGLGVMTLGIVLFADLRILGLTGMYNTESSDRRFRFGIYKTVLCILGVYTALMLLCAISYFAAGMSPFDAACHAMSTVSTGGFGNYDDSLGHFASAKIEVVAVIFMLLASCPFVAYLALIFDSKFPSKQYVVFICVVVICSLLSAIKLWCEPNGYGFITSVRYAFFTIVSLGTSTGFVNFDYTQLGFLTVLGVILTICGGCSGSTNGGIKIYRIMVLLKEGYRYVHNMLSDQGNNTQSSAKTNFHSISEVGIFFFLYILSLCISCVIISWIEDDMSTVFTSVSATFSNTGPGAGSVVGPLGNYASLAISTKLVLTALMLIGRLELIPVFIFMFFISRSGVLWLLGCYARARKYLICSCNRII